MDSVFEVVLEDKTLLLDSGGSTSTWEEKGERKETLPAGLAVLDMEHKDEHERLCIGRGEQRQTCRYALALPTRAVLGWYWGGIGVVLGLASTTPWDWKGSHALIEWTEEAKCSPTARNVLVNTSPWMWSQASGTGLPHRPDLCPPPNSILHTCIKPVYLPQGRRIVFFKQ